MQPSRAPLPDTFAAVAAMVFQTLTAEHQARITDVERYGRQHAELRERHDEKPAEVPARRAWPRRWRLHRVTP